MYELVILIAVLLLCIVYLWQWFKPEIEIVSLVKHYRVYLWYDKYDESGFKGRVYKFLFEI